MRRVLMVAVLSAGMSASVAEAKLRLAVNSVSFASPRNGLVGGALCSSLTSGVCTPVLADTFDAGAHFSVTRRLGQPTRGGPIGLGASVFAASPSLAYVVRRRAFETFDGGRHLYELPLPGDVLGFGAAGSGAFAVTHPCAPSRQCSPRLWHSSDAGRHWWYTSLRAADTSDDPAFRFAAVDSSNVLLSYVRPPLRSDPSTVRTGLLASSNGGHTWYRVRTPCPASDKGVVPAALNLGELWLACNSSGGAGRVFHSVDGGVHWSHGLPWYAWSIQATAPGAAVASTLKAGLLATRDGGRTWRQARRIDPGDGTGFGTVARAGPSSVWAITPLYRLERSLDGGATWRWLRGTGFPDPCASGC